MPGSLEGCTAELLLGMPEAGHELDVSGKSWLRSAEADSVLFRGL